MTLNIDTASLRRCKMEMQQEKGGETIIKPWPVDSKSYNEFDVPITIR